MVLKRETSLHISYKTNEAAEKWSLAVSCVEHSENRVHILSKKWNQLLKKLSLNGFTSISEPWFLDLDEVKIDRLPVLGFVI